MTSRTKAKRQAKKKIPPNSWKIPQDSVSVSTSACWCCCCCYCCWLRNKFYLIFIHPTVDFNYSLLSIVFLDWLTEGLEDCVSFVYTIHVECVMLLATLPNGRVISQKHPAVVNRFDCCTWDKFKNV